MLTYTIAFLATAALAGAQSSSAIVAAPQVTNNPVGAEYVAQLPVKATTNVVGNVKGVSSPDGKGVVFSVSLNGFPAEGGPFMYHIHEKPVPADGNCTGTGAHLDPYKRGEVPICDSSKKETCQTGDLSGKYGNITGNAFSGQYTDLYTSTNPSDPSYFGNLSIVVHLSNKTRISCANFTRVAGGVSSVPVGTASSGYAMPSGTGTGHANNTLSLSPTATGTGTDNNNDGTATAVPPSPTAPQSTGAASTLYTGAGVFAAGLLAMLL